MTQKLNKEQTNELLAKTEALRKKNGLSAAEACKQVGWTPSRYYSAVYTRKGKGAAPKVVKKYGKKAKAPKHIDIIPAAHPVQSIHTQGDKMVLVLGTASELQALLKGLI